MRHATEIIGPEEAQALLGNLMPHYRPADMRQVELYAKLMRQGAWKDTPEPIRVDEELGLVDGRRRLEALVRAGVELGFTVVRGKFDFLREQA
jgi:hypothetical protein